MQRYSSDFDTTGSVQVMSRAELEEQRRKRGKCVRCGQKCFQKKLPVFKMIPITEHGKVENGRCLNCHPPIDPSVGKLSEIFRPVTQANLKCVSRSQTILKVGGNQAVPKRGTPNGGQENRRAVTQPIFKNSSCTGGLQSNPSRRNIINDNSVHTTASDPSVRVDRTNDGEASVISTTSSTRGAVGVHVTGRSSDSLHSVDNSPRNSSGMGMSSGILPPSGASNTGSFLPTSTRGVSGSTYHSDHSPFSNQRRCSFGGSDDGFDHSRENRRYDHKEYKRKRKSYLVSSTDEEKSQDFAHHTQILDSNCNGKVNLENEEKNVTTKNISSQIPKRVQEFKKSIVPKSCNSDMLRSGQETKSEITSIQVQASAKRRAKVSKETVTTIPDCDDPSLVTVGSRVSIYWDGEDEYFEGTVTKELRGKRRPFRVRYDDGDKDWVNFSNERFRLLKRCVPNNSNVSTDGGGKCKAVDRTVEHLVTIEDKSIIEPKTNGSLKVTETIPATTCTIQDQKRIQPLLIVNEIQAENNTSVDLDKIQNRRCKDFDPKCVRHFPFDVNKALPDDETSTSAASTHYLPAQIADERKDFEKQIPEMSSELQDTPTCEDVHISRIANIEPEKLNNLSCPKTSIDEKINSCASSGKASISENIPCMDESIKVKSLNPCTDINGLSVSYEDEGDWVGAAIHRDSSDSETDDEEVEQWALKMFGITKSTYIQNAISQSNNPPKGKLRCRGKKRSKDRDCLSSSSYGTNYFDSVYRPPCIEDETVEKRKREEARPLTSEEIRAILGEENDLEGQVGHWVRRSSRQPSKSALASPKIKSLLEKLRCNDSDMVVLKMKKYCSDSTTPQLVINTVLEALEENTNCEALYIQNFNLGMRDEQVLHLLRILQRPSCKIWCLNIGETYNVQTETWEIFAAGLRDTKITHMYASEHTISTELKDEIRATIRKNRKKHNMHIDPNNIDTIIQCTHCWWNPINAAVLRPYIKRIGIEPFLLDADAQGLPGTMSGAKYLECS